MSGDRKDSVAARIGAVARKASHPSHAAIDHLDALKASMEPLPNPDNNEKDA